MKASKEIIEQVELQTEMVSTLAYFGDITIGDKLLQVKTVVNGFLQYTEYVLTVDGKVVLETSNLSKAVVAYNKVDFT